jgi:hypothetical protein
MTCLDSSYVNGASAVVWTEHFLVEHIVVAFTWEVVLFKGNDSQQVADMLGEVGVCDPYCCFGCLRIHASLQTPAQQQSAQQLRKARHLASQLGIERQHNIATAVAVFAAGNLGCAVCWTAGAVLCWA